MREEFELRCKTPTQSIQDTLEVIGGKWKIIILAALFEKKFRFKELAKYLEISPRMLSKELQDLEVNQLITRTVCDTKPITVEYKIAEHSKSLIPLIEAMIEWGAQHRDKITGRKKNTYVAPTT